MAFRRSSGRARRLRRYVVAGLGDPRPIAVPAVLVAPSILAQAVVQTGRELIGVDADVVNLGANTLTRAWLFGSTVLATGRVFTPNAAGAYTYRNQVIAPGGAVLFTAAASIEVAALVPAPTPAPSPPSARFTSLPAIGADGSPQVGEILTLDFGTITGDTIGARQILRADDSVLATVDTGSYQLAEAGQIKLRSYAATTVGLYAETALITIAARASSATPAPTIAFPPTKDDGSPYDTSTNPPRVVLGIPESLDKLLYRAILYFDRASGGALQVADSRMLVIEDLMAAADAEEAVFSDFGDLAAGSLRQIALFQLKADGSNGPATDILTTTLAAPALPPATTTFDQANRSSYVTLSTDQRSMTAHPGVGEPMAAAATAPRDDERYFEIEQTLPSSAGDGSWGGGIIAAATAVGSFYQPDGAVYITADRGDAGQVLGFQVKPASKEGTIDGLVIFFGTDGAEVARKPHSFASYRAYAFAKRASTLKLKAGQEAFAFAKPASAKPYL